MSAPIHRIFGRPLDAEMPKGFDQAIFGMGCYWGVERLFWQLDGVWLTEVGFAGGTVPDPRGALEAEAPKFADQLAKLAAETAL